MGGLLSLGYAHTGYGVLLHYKDWWLSKTEVMERLDPNNYKVDAYYLTDEDGKATDVYIFQNDRLIDKLEDVGTFNTADAEQTDEDKEIFVKQQKKIAAFNAYVKKNAIAAVGISKPEHSEEAASPPPIELPPMESEPPICPWAEALGSYWLQALASVSCRGISSGSGGGCC